MKAGLSLSWASGSREKPRAEDPKPSALPSSHSCRRSGRSAALPYPPHEWDDSIMVARGGPLFDTSAS
jgi:hypothetical protein